MRATYPCQACGLCLACGPEASAQLVAPTAANAQCFRRSLRFPFVQHHAAKGHTAGLRCAHPAVSQQDRAKPGSIATKYKTTASAELASPEPAPVASQPAKAQEFAGLGAQRTLDFLAAWDQLALRLPPQAGMGTAAELILNALKLEVSHLPLPNETLQATTAASKALAVASQLADLSGQGFPLDAESIAAGILVDAVAAQRLSLELVDDRLGPAVADLIEDIIKVRKLPSRVDLYDDIASSSLRELALTFYDTRAIVVEVVSRLIGMGGLVGTPQYARQLAALEALQIYAPLGHGLGLRPLCAQLEDRCFQELFPESYAETAAWLRREVTANGDSLAQCEQQLQQAVEQDPHFQSLAAGCQVAGRTKSLFSTMKKLLRLDSIEAGGRAKQEVHDILASRCVVTPHPDLPPEQAEDLACQACYVVASKSVELFEEITSRRKDYIARPKDNGYQSLHCTVKLPPVTVECEGRNSPGQGDAAVEECLLKEGPTCELQIRTQRMHELAESGGAAHAAYKGGLDALQANRLKAWTRTLRALPPALSSPEVQPQEWSNQAAAAEQLFSHLDRDGDGYISVREVAILLEELGVDVGEQQAGAARQGQALGQDQDLGQLPCQGTGQKLLAVLANKEPSRVSFEEFLQFNSQASLLGALPKVDTETARSLRRSTSAAQEALLGAAHPPTFPHTPSSGNCSQPHATGKVDSEGDSEVESATSSQDDSPSSTSSVTMAESPGTDAASPSVTALHDAFRQSVQSRRASGSRPQASAPAYTSSTSASCSPLLSIPYTSNAQSLAATPFSKVSTTARPCASSTRVGCHAWRPTSHSHASPSGQSLFACMPSGSARLRNQAHCRGRVAVRLGKVLMPSHKTAGLSAAACSGNGCALSVPLSSTWRLHAAGSHNTTAETADSEAASTKGSSLDAAAPLANAQASSDTSATVEQALDEAAIIDRRSSHKQASSSSSSSSSQNIQEISSSDAADLLGSKHNESTLSLDLSSLPEPSSSPSLPPPQPMTKRPGQAFSQRAPLGESSDAAALLERKGHNESTISLDLNNLPVPAELVHPPARPRRPPSRNNGDPGLFPNLPNSMDWDDLQVEQPPRARPAPTPQPPRKQGPANGSWDNLQPLFRPPPPPPKEPLEASNDAVAVDIMFSALQNKRYKHVKGTSYNDATFALVPVDRKIGWRLGCDEEVTVNQPIHIPQHGPLLLGGDASQEAICDVILEGASQAGAAVHSRLEIFHKGRKPCCLVTCKGPFGTTYVNRTQLPRLVDTEVYLGDILSFGKLTMAFQFVPIFLPKRQKSALDDALQYIEPLATTKTPVPKDYAEVARMVRAMSYTGSKKFPAARSLMATALSRDPDNAEGWAQLANMERRMTTENLPECGIPAARCFYRAAAELIQQRLDANESPNGEAQRGSQRYRNLMAAMTSFIRVMSSWAQLEFDNRNETPARRLYRRAMESVPHDPAPIGADLKQPIKLLFKWAHQEFKTDNLYQSRELLLNLLQLEPSNTRALGMLGSLEWKAGRRTLARKYLTAGIKADPKHVSNLHSLARLELEEGNLQDARKLFARGQQLEPQNAYILQSWALAEAAEGDLELARDMLQKATMVQPQSVPCWHAWAKLELTAGNADKARELYLKALKLNPKETVTYSALGALERKSGNLDLAMEYLNKALELTPRHPPACVEKAIVLMRQGKVNHAATFSDMAVREKTQVDYKRGIERKPASEFFRSSEAQQEDRRARQKKDSQAKAKKTVATQKGRSTRYNRARRKKEAKARAQASKKAAAQEQAKATAKVQASIPFERVVSVSE